MDPYLEHPAIWPDVHNRLIAAIADNLAPRLRPRYYVALEQRTYQQGDRVVSGPLLPVVKFPEAPFPDPPVRFESTAPGVELHLVVRVEHRETFLQIHAVTTKRLMTVLEVLSPANKIHSRGRQEYEARRKHVFRAGANLVEMDLLRAGKPMPVAGQTLESDYRILVSRGVDRECAQLLALSVRDPLPDIFIPLASGEIDLKLELNFLVHSLYELGGFDLRIDYSQAPVPPLRAGDAPWAAELIRKSLDGRAS